MNRTHWILCGLLAVQILLLLVVSQPFASHGPAEAHPLLSGIDPAEVSRIEIRSSQGESVVLSRDGDSWGLSDAGGYPADDGQVRQMLDTLIGLEVRRPVVTSARYHKALEVADDTYERRLRLWTTQDDEASAELFLGTSPNYRVIHVRRGGEDEVYEVRGLSAYDLRADTSAWVAKRFVDIPVEDVVSFKLTNASGTIEVARSGEEGGGWQLVSPEQAPRALDADAVESMVGSVSQLWISDPAGPLDDERQGFDQPVATVEIRYVERPESETEPQVLTLRVGAEAPDGDGKRYAARSGFDYAALLGSYDVEKIAEKKLDDLLVAVEDDD